MSVVGGLTHSALARLSKTNQEIPSDTQKVRDFVEHTKQTGKSQLILGR